MAADPRLAAARVRAQQLGLQRQAAVAAAARPRLQQSPVAQMGRQQAAQAQAAQQAQVQSRTGLDYLAMVRSGQTAGGAPEGKKPGGLLGKVVGNPVVANILKPLSLIDLPRAFAVSGIKEIADSIDGDDSTDGSFGEFAQQGKDHIGFGDVVDFDNKWANRIAGLAGDVALDPLTYLTLGAGKFAGTAGRGALAAQATRELGETMSRPALEELLGRVGRSGVHGLEAAERQALNIPEAGIRFAGQRIPGTAGVANAGGEALAAVRRPLTDTVIGRGARALGGGRAPATRGAIEALSTGKGDLVDAANHLRASTAETIGGRQFVGEQAAVAKNLGKEFRGRADLVDEIEAAALSGVPLTPDAQRLANAFDDIGGAAQSSGLTGLQKVQGYAGPRVQTADLREFLGRTPNNIIKDSVDKASGRTMHRAWVPGTYDIGGKKVTFNTATRQEITQVLSREFPELAGKKLFEDNPEYLLAKYVEDLSSDVGKVSALNELKTGGSAAAVFDAADPTVAGFAPAGPVQRTVDPAQVQTGRNQLTATQGPFWREHAKAEPQRVDALSATADLVDQQGGISTDLRNLAATPSPRHVEDTMAHLDDSERAMVDAVAKLNPADPDFAPTKQLVDDWVARKTAMGPKADAVMDARKFFNDAKAGTLTQPIMQIIKDGFEEVGKNLVADDLAIQSVVKQAMDNVSTALADPNAFWGAVDGYTKFFKAYATATPGFHVRNAMSATFMNATDGVTPRSMARGVKIWQAFRAEPEGKWWAALPMEMQDHARETMRAVYGSGAGGQYSAAELGHSVREARSGARRAVDKLTHNKLTETSSKWGEKVEGAVRAGMAYDTISKGGGVDEAVARVTRIHFDYSQVNEVDVFMKRLIPFWTFMSRNLPLQTQQMWMNPRIYNQYQSLVRNMGMQDPEGQPMPMGIAERGGFRITDGMGLAPDLPHTRVAAEWEKLGDPMRMLSNANPLLRVPMELMAGRNFFNDYSLDEKPTEVGWDMSPLSMLGMTDEAGDGTEVIDQRIPYALRNLLPPLAQLQRLIPSKSDEYYDERQMQSIANYLGIPLQQLSPEVIKRELERRQRATTQPEDPYEQALASFQR